MNRTLLFTVRGENFADVTKLKVIVGSSICKIISHKMEGNDYIVDCSLNIQAGSHILKLHHTNNGFSLNNFTLICKPMTTAIIPKTGSIYGNTIVTVTGNGYICPSLIVKFGLIKAKILSCNTSHIVCVTPAGNGDRDVRISSTSQNEIIEFPDITFSHHSSVTPKIVPLTPNKVLSGDVLTIEGTFFTEDIDIVTVLIGVKNCNVLTCSLNTITCTLPNFPAGKQTVQVQINGYGLSNSDEVSYKLNVANIQPLESGFGGGLYLLITGLGFSNESSVAVCGEECIKENVTSEMIKCRSPVYKSYSQVADDELCDIVVTEGTISATYNEQYAYRKHLTSTITNVSPSRGGTGGGVRLHITGTNFLEDISKVDVKIGDSICIIKEINETYILCITGPSSLTLQNIDVEVNLRDRGTALPLDAKFSYVDLWSSIYTWGGKAPPIAGKFDYFLTNYLVIYSFHLLFLFCVYLCLIYFLFFEK